MTFADGLCVPFCRKESLDEGVSMTSVPMSPFLTDSRGRNPNDPDTDLTNEVSSAPNAEGETFVENRTTDPCRSSFTDRSKPMASVDSERNMDTLSGNVSKTRPTNAMSPISAASPLRETLNSVVSSNQIPLVLNSTESSEPLVQKKSSAEPASSASCGVSDEEDDTEPDFLTEEISMLTEESVCPLPTDSLRKRSLPHIHRPRRPSTPRFMEDNESEKDEDGEEEQENGYTLPHNQQKSSAFVSVSRTLAASEDKDNSGDDSEGDKQCRETIVPNILVDSSTRAPETAAIVSDYGSATDSGHAEELPDISEEEFTSLEVFQKVFNLPEESEETSMEAEECDDVPSRMSCLSDEMPSISEEYEDTILTPEEERVTLQQSNASHSSDTVSAAPDKSSAAVEFRMTSDASEETHPMISDVETPVTDHHRPMTSSHHSLTATENTQCLVAAERGRGESEDQRSTHDRSRMEIDFKNMETMEPDARSNCSLHEETTIGESGEETLSCESETALEIIRDMECKDAVAIINDENTIKTDDEEIETADIRSQISEEGKTDAEISSDETSREWQLANEREEPKQYEDMIGRGFELERLTGIKHTLRKSIDMEGDDILFNESLKRRKEECDRTEDRLVHNEEIVEKEENNEPDNKERSNCDGIEAGKRRNSCQLTEIDHEDKSTTSKYSQSTPENNAEDDFIESNYIAIGSSNENPNGESPIAYSDEFTVGDPNTFHVVGLRDTTAVNLLLSSAEDNPVGVDHALVRDSVTNPSGDVIASGSEAGSEECLPIVIDISNNGLQSKETNSLSFIGSDSATDIKLFRSPAPFDTSSDCKSVISACKENSSISDDLSARTDLSVGERIASDEFLDLMLEPLLDDDFMTTDEFPALSPSVFQPSKDDSSDMRINVESTAINPPLTRSLIVTADLREDIGAVHQNNTRFSTETRNISESNNSKLTADEHPQISTADETESQETDENRMTSPLDSYNNSDVFLTSDMVLAPSSPHRTQSPNNGEPAPEQTKLEMSETYSASESKTYVKSPFTSESLDNRDVLLTDAIKHHLLDKDQASATEERTSDRTEGKEADCDMVGLIINSTLHLDGDPDLQAGMNVVGSGPPTSMQNFQQLNDEASFGGRVFLTSDEIEPRMENGKHTEVQSKLCVEEEIPGGQTIPAEKNTNDPPLPSSVTSTSDSISFIDPENGDVVSESEEKFLSLNTLNSASSNIHVSLSPDEVSQPVSFNRLQKDIPGNVTYTDVCKSTSDPQSTLFTFEQDVHIPVIIPKKEVSQNSCSINEIGEHVNSTKGTEGVPLNFVGEDNRFANLTSSRRSVESFEASESHSSTFETFNTLPSRNTAVTNEEGNATDFLTTQIPVLKTFHSAQGKSNEVEQRSEITVGLYGPEIASKKPDRPTIPDTELDQPCISLESLQHSLVFVPLVERLGAVDNISLPHTGIEDDSKSAEYCDITQAVSHSKQRIQPVFPTLNPTATQLNAIEKEGGVDSDQVPPPLPDSAPPTIDAMPNSYFWLQPNEEFKLSPPEAGPENFAATDLNGNILLEQDFIFGHKEADADEDDKETKRTESTIESSSSDIDNDKITFSSCVRLQCDSRGISNPTIPDTENAVEERMDARKQLSIRFLQGIGSNIHWNFNEEDRHQSQDLRRSDPLVKTPAGDSSAVIHETDDMDNIDDTGGVGNQSSNTALIQDVIGKETALGSIPIAILSYAPTAVEAVSETNASVVSINPEEIATTTSARTVRRTRSNQVNDH